MLQCISPYKSSLGAYQPGDMIDAPELEAALLHDSPGSFAVHNVIEVTAAPEAPEVDKQIKRRTRA